MREYQGIDDVGVILNPENCMVLLASALGRDLAFTRFFLSGMSSVSLSFFFFLPLDYLLMLILVSHLPYDIGVL